ncbi:MAG: hypothetical protein M3410_03600 [Acidobacteriota bacterium]|nr:hypothetical protein [Acidobacteriota bacterium]
MKDNYSSIDNSAVPYQALPLPHFDEDATLLSARPVVPLYEVKTEPRSKRRAIFGLTILAAILVGAIGATLLLMQGEQNSQTAAEAQVSQPGVIPSAAAGGSASESAEAMVPVPVLAERVEEPRMREIPSARESSTKKPPTETISRSSVKPARAGSPDRDRDDDFEGDRLRRVERRDARREARRERRHRREQGGDDLLRIREIFEGARP